MFSNENTPTPLPPPPRRVHGGPGCAIWFMRLFILPHTLIGIGLIGYFILTVLAAAFGTDITATVTKAHTEHRSKGGMNYHVDYTYSADGRQYTNSDNVGASTFAAVNRPAEIEEGTATVRVRHLNLSPWHRQLLIEGHSPWVSAGQMLFAALFWNGILSIFLTLAWVLPIRKRNLIRHGFATTGTIVSKRMREGKSISYHATFGFRNPEDGQEFKREMQLTGKTDYEAAKAGQPVTVIYSERNPRRAIIYELSGYHVPGPTPGSDHF